ncbi:caspase family protein, partial [bacterium]|nr:caspase family protein [bacterium]
MNKIIISLCLTTLICSGCIRQIVDGHLSGTDTLLIETQPKGVTLHKNGVYISETPCTIPFNYYGPSGGEKFDITLSKSGYGSQTIHFERSMLSSKYFAGNYQSGSKYGAGNTFTFIYNLPREQSSTITQNLKGSSPAVTQETQLISRKDPMNNWAVIIGISQYQYSGQKGLTNLIFADDDAKSFTRSLHNLGWSDSHIKLLINEDATQRNITIALESWLTKAGPNDQIVLFWAGHGFPDPEDPEKVYFACYDTDISIPATGYRMDRVRRSIEERKSKNVVLLADTCHAGKLITRSDGSRGISIVPNIKRQNVPKGWVFMVGADTDRQAIEHASWSNGAFTHSLIKGLNGEADGFQSAGAKDGIVTMGELKDYMN